MAPWLTVYLIATYVAGIILGFCFIADMWIWNGYGSISWRARLTLLTILAAAGAPFCLPLCMLVALGWVIKKAFSGEVG